MEPEAKSLELPSGRMTLSMDVATSSLLVADEAVTSPAGKLAACPTRTAGRRPYEGPPQARRETVNIKERAKSAYAGSAGRQADLIQRHGGTERKEIAFS